jgi:hypothetical protein
MCSLWRTSLWVRRLLCHIKSLSSLFIDSAPFTIFTSSTMHKVPSKIEDIVHSTWKTWKTWFIIFRFENFDKKTSFLFCVVKQFKVRKESTKRTIWSCLTKFEKTIMNTEKLNIMWYMVSAPQQSLIRERVGPLSINPSKKKLLQNILIIVMEWFALKWLAVVYE